MFQALRPDLVTEPQDSVLVVDVTVRFEQRDSLTGEVFVLVTCVISKI